MSEIRERMKAAMIRVNEESLGLLFTELLEEMAMAALKELREPTEEMKDAGYKASPHDVGGCRDQIEDDKDWMAMAVVEPFQAMIDAALTAGRKAA